MSALAVTQGGSCERIMLVGDKEVVVRQRWALHARHGLQLYTSLVNDMAKGKVGKEHIFNPEAGGGYLFLGVFGGGVGDGGG